MFENKFALLGFGTVVAAGLAAAYMGTCQVSRLWSNRPACEHGTAQTTAYSARDKLRTPNCP